MKALLPNSGIGRRMGALTAMQPKCMCPLGDGETIIGRQLRQLSKQGVDEAIVTTGPFAQLLEDYIASLKLPMRFTYRHNPRYAKTNYIYSMYLAADLLAGDEIILLHGDLVMVDSVMRELVEAKQSVIAVDSTLPLPEKDFKARLQDGLVVAVDVPLFGPDCVACQPAYHWTADGFACWMNAIESFCRRGQIGVYAEQAFNAQNGAIDLFPMEVSGRLCHEIDTPEDLEIVAARAKAEVE